MLTVSLSTAYIDSVNIQLEARGKCAMKRRRETYHHGDARNALLTAAAALLEGVGAQGLSLRQVAEKAHLSRQAPYNHFADKEELLAELVRDGFQRLESRIRGMKGYPGSATALERAGEAYIEFAQRAPALFRLMFSRELVDLARFPEATAASAACYGSLTAIVATLTTADRVAELSLAAWCLVHGYATLCIETGLEGENRRAQRARLFARLIRTEAADPGKR
jgi:AcrR family transcriptional regulator